MCASVSRRPNLCQIWRQFEPPIAKNEKNCMDLSTTVKIFHFCKATPFEKNFPAHNSKADAICVYFFETAKNGQKAHLWFSKLCGQYGPGLCSLYIYTDSNIWSYTTSVMLNNFFLIFLFCNKIIKLNKLIKTNLKSFLFYFRNKCQRNSEILIQFLLFCLYVFSAHLF